MKRLTIVSLLLCGVLSGCKETILHDLDELQANRVRVVLSQAGLDCDKQREGSKWSIAVDKSAVTRALSGIEESRVLRQELARREEQSGSLVQSREERMQLVERQMSRNLEETLESLPDVLEARVHLYLDGSEKFSLVPEPSKQSASVLMITSNAAAINREQIQQLVSGASGISASAVSLIVSVSTRAAMGRVSRAEAPGKVELPAVSKPPITPTPLSATFKQPVVVGAVMGIFLAICAWSSLVFRRRSKKAPPSKSIKAPPTREPLRPPERVYQTNTGVF